MSWKVAVLIILGGFVILGVVAITVVWAMWSKASDVVKHDITDENDDD